MKTEKEIRSDIVQILGLLWDRGHANTTGVSISERIDDNNLIVDQSGTGFRLCKVTEDDLLIIDNECNLIEDAPNRSLRKAPVNVVIHTEYYKANPLARACIHCHAPFSQVFACENKSIQPYILQANILGEVPCVYVDDRKSKEEYLSNNMDIEIPSGLHCRGDVLFTMSKVAKAVVDILKPRNSEMEKHGLAVLHYQHGLFVFGRNIWEAFDNLERVEANARAILYSKLIK